MERLNYPRPDWIRERTVLLNGDWEFSFDEPSYDMHITVPFCYESRMSGIGITEHHDIVWYRCHFSYKKCSGHVLLCFGAVDHDAEVYLNGSFIGRHSGGFTPFSFDITGCVKEDNVLEVKAVDYNSPYLPEGKQRWTKDNFGCWYTPVTGIWQSVWLEYAGDTPAEYCHFIPSLENHSVEIELSVLNGYTGKARIDFSLSGKNLGSAEIHVEKGIGKALHSFSYDDVRPYDLLWSPENPNLIDADITILTENADSVHAYFGMREISVSQGRIYLNGNLLYQRLVLDQGYWPESLLTPPSADALMTDIKSAIDMGFNGARKHQKAEDPRFYYLADKLGFLVWGELQSWHRYSEKSMGAAVSDLIEQISRDYNHPSIITWVPVNESWGVGEVMTSEREYHFVAALYHLLSAYDPVRLVSSNDGWEQPSETDIIAIHDYMFSSEFASKYDNPFDLIESNVAERRAIMRKGASYSGQPIMLTEFGGIAFADGSDDTWGYYGKVRTAEDFISRLKEALQHLEKAPIAGYCYTQLTDVEQETNGLMTADRRMKLSSEEYRKVFLP